MDQDEGTEVGATCLYFFFYKNVVRYTTNFHGEVEAFEHHSKIYLLGYTNAKT